MFTMTLDQHFVSLRNISDNVDDYLTRELWREEFSYEEDGVRVNDDDITPSDILGRCYAIIIEELKDFGIYLVTPEDDIVEDIYTCGHLYLVRKLVDYTHLVELLSATNLTNTVYTYLQSEEAKTDILRDLVEILLTRTNNFEVSEIQYILSNLYTDEKFEKYLHKVLETLKEEKPVDFLPQLTAVNDYVRKVQGDREEVNKWVDVLTTHYESQYTLDYPKIKKLLRDYDLDKISPNSVGLFALIDTGDEINPALLTMQHNLLEAHHRNSPHHIEFWLHNVNQVPFTIENLMLLVAHHAEPMVDSDEFREKVDEMLQKGDNFLGPQYKALAVEMRDLIIKELDGDSTEDWR